MHELAPLMQILASEGDYIYQPDSEGKTATLLNHLGEVIPLGQAVPPLRLSLWANEGHIIQSIQPWARARGLELHYPLLSPAYMQLSHRRSSSKLLQYLLSPQPELIPRPEIIPTWCSIKADDLEHYSAYYLSLGYKQLVLKRPYSSSGRGVEALDLPLSPERKELIIKQIQAYEAISLEPLLDRVQDYAMLFYYDTEEVSLVGYSKFLTDTNRGFAYAGNILIPDEAIEAELIQILGSQEQLIALQEEISSFLSEQLQNAYEGYIGIDMMSYRDASGQIRLHPAIEINVRCTMGVLAQRLAHEMSIAEGACFRVGYASAKQMTDLKTRGNNLQILTPNTASTGFLAYIEHPIYPTQSQP